MSMGLSRPVDWSGESFPSSRDLPNPGTELRSPELQADSLPSEPPGKPGKSEAFLSCDIHYWAPPRGLT